jgi:hypothetical protein
MYDTSYRYLGLLEALGLDNSNSRLAARQLGVIRVRCGGTVDLLVKPLYLRVEPIVLKVLNFRNFNIQKIKQNIFDPTYLLFSDKTTVYSAIILG